MGATKSDGREKDEGEGDIMDDSILTRAKAFLNRPINKLFIDENFTPDTNDADIEAIIEEIKSDREKERRKTPAQRAANVYEPPTTRVSDSPLAYHMRKRLAEATNTMAVLEATSLSQAKLEEMRANQAEILDKKRADSEEDDLDDFLIEALAKNPVLDTAGLLDALKRLKDETDETIEMAPGVHAHSIDLVIEMIKERLK